tara:strand:+ start:2986 stop:3120 length:135 start_codon:yes stop_codon:yes gene_type:complete
VIDSFFDGKLGVFFSFWRKRLFYNPGKEKKKKKFLLVFEQAVFG